jgi:hypothetical protein
MAVATYDLVSRNRNPSWASGRRMQTLERAAARAPWAVARAPLPGRTLHLVGVPPVGPPWKPSSPSSAIIIRLAATTERRAERSRCQQLSVPCSGSASNPSEHAARSGVGEQQHCDLRAPPPHPHGHTAQARVRELTLGLAVAGRKSSSFTLTDVKLFTAT